MCAAACGEPSHVLVAEDSGLVAEVIRNVLEEQGFRVSLVQSVAEALEVAEQSPPNLVLSDLRLPDGTGWELLARIRASRPVPAIMMSGYSDETYRVESRKADFDEYLVKPVNPDVLCERVARLIGRPEQHGRKRQPRDEPGSPSSCGGSTWAMAAIAITARAPGPSSADGSRGRGPRRHSRTRSDRAWPAPGWASAGMLSFSCN